MQGPVDWEEQTSSLVPGPWLPSVQEDNTWRLVVSC